MTKPRLRMMKPAVASLQRTMAGITVDRQRGTSNERGYTYCWQQYRKRWLERHPLCGDREAGPSGEHSRCARDGMVVPATDVDHIERIMGPDDPLFWDPANHQSLCHACHSVKTQHEQAGGRSESSIGSRS